MRFPIDLAFISFFSLAAAGAALGSPISSSGPVTERAAASVATAENEAPIVSGRSISARHKSKMHHVRTAPDQAIEGPFADEEPAPNR
jgi:hypothetical protein